MSSRSGLAIAFKHFGAKGRNPRWSWSARTPDGSTVVLALWKDRFDNSAKPAKYRSGARDFGDPVTHGAKERRENLIWARDRCDGKFRVVVVVAQDIGEKVRKIADCYAQPNLTMRILNLDEVTGEFEAEIA